MIQNIINVSLIAKKLRQRKQQLLKPQNKNFVK
jgi:hypothetical protein